MVDYLLSPYTGLVKHIYVDSHQLDEPGFPRFATTLPAWFRQFGTGVRLAGFSASEDKSSAVDAPTWSGGAHLEWKEARMRALGEAAERYAATFIPINELVYASAADLGNDALNPDEAVQFTDGQLASAGFPYKPFEATTRLKWVKGLRLPDMKPTYIPAQFVFLSRAVGTLPPTEEAIWEPTSNGLACGPSLPDAALRALLEALERDALLITWYHSLSMPRLSWENSREFEAVDESYFAPTKLEYTSVDLSQIHDVPTVLTIVRAPMWGEAMLTCGAAAGESLFHAWYKATLEAFYVRVWGRRRSRSAASNPAVKADGEGVKTFDDHIAYFADPRRASVADFLDGSRAIRHVSDGTPLVAEDSSALLRDLTSRLAAGGITTYLVDVTSPDLREIGLSVARIVAPRLCSLNADHAARALGNPRLPHAAATLGLGPCLSPLELNPYPHPMA